MDGRLIFASEHDISRIIVTVHLKDVAKTNKLGYELLCIQTAMMA